MQDAPMSRARYMQENRKMRFEEAYEGWSEGRLTQAEAALLLGQCERSFRRHVERYQADGLDGLLDRPPEPGVQTPRQRGRSGPRGGAVQVRLCRLERGALSQQVQGPGVWLAQLQLAQEREVGRDQEPCWVAFGRKRAFEKPILESRLRCWDSRHFGVPRN